MSTQNKDDGDYDGDDGVDEGDDDDDGGGIGRAHV